MEDFSSTMPAFVRLAASSVLVSWRVAARNCWICALLVLDSSSRIDDWFRICWGLPVVRSAIEELRLPSSYAVTAMRVISCRIEANRLLSWASCLLMRASR